MQITLDTTATPARLRLAGEMTIYAASDLHRQLLAHFGDCGGMALDLSAVEEIDCAALQLLLCARQHATAAGKAFELAAISRPVGALLDLFGLAAFFGEPPLADPVTGQPRTDEPA